jgi:uncharacterized protein
MDALAELDRHRYVSLATFRRSGAEVRTPVWFAAAGSQIYVFTMGESGKVKRLRHSSRARVAPSDARGDIRGGWHDAAARVVTEPASIERGHGALLAKYRWQMRLADFFSWLSGRIRRRAWIEIELSMILVMLTLAGCASGPASRAVAAPDVAALAGTWRGWLATEQDFNAIDLTIRPDGSFEVSGPRVRAAGVLVPGEGSLRFDGTGPWRGTLVPEGSALRLLRDDHLYRGTLYRVPRAG